MTLVIMAAGMGSRFGGLKQIEPVGPSGEFIIDYSIYDAIQAGFKKVVFVIKRENYDIFKETVGKRVEPHIQVEYAFQELDDLPEGFSCPPERTRPWGTSHAILSVEKYIDGNFGAINADDFYGRDAFVVLANFLKQASEREFCLVGYPCANTLPLHGIAKRGVCHVKDGFLEKISESHCEDMGGGKIMATPLDGSTPFEVAENQLASMSVFGFAPKIFPFMKKKFRMHLEENRENLEEYEYLIVDTISEGIVEKEWNVKVLTTTAKWYGITYKEDKEGIVKAIEEMISKGEYPKQLWS
ncbi:MAG: nucleotidyltransferase family protein [Candidatus Dojkabacteria bacterium]|jgi:NDP-sugar pyrophosphorylase family protein